MKKILKIKIFAKFILLFGLCSSTIADQTKVQNEDGEPSIASKLIPENQTGLVYKIIWKTKLDDKILEKFEEVSELIALQKRPPGSYGGLLKRVEQSKKLLLKILASHGYFDSDVEISIQKKTPIIIEFKVSLGTCYRLRDVIFRANEHLCTIHLKSLNIPYEILKVYPKDKIEVIKFQQAQDRIKKYCYNHGYPFAEVNEPQAILDKDNKLVDVIYVINLGILAYIKDTYVHPMPGLSQSFIHNRLLWKNGDTFDARVLEKSRKKLSETGVLDNVIITPKPLEEGNKQEAVPVVMDIKATEGPPRAIGAGLKYATSYGCEANLFWRHYNVGGNGEYINAGLILSKVRSKIGVNYDVPDFLIPNQKLANEIYILREVTRAYKSTLQSVGSRLQRSLNQYFTGSLGLVAETGNVTRSNIKYNNQLIGAPIELIFDASNDLLNPTRGVRAKGKFIPYTGKLGKSKGMGILRGGGSAYLPAYTDQLEEDIIVLAGFVRGGILYIRDFNNLPPNKRFYSGGSGSIRGYTYQMLGPIDNNRTPIGGESLLEAGGELRCHVSENIGVVTFLEAGSVSIKKIPQLKNNNLLYGAGFGVRYYTSIGPIRFDIAFPLKRRKDVGNKPIDAAVQFYISIGEAF